MSFLVFVVVFGQCASGGDGGGGLVTKNTIFEIECGCCCCVHLSNCNSKRVHIYSSSSCVV